MVAPYLPALLALLPGTFLGQTAAAEPDAAPAAPDAAPAAPAAEAAEAKPAAPPPPEAKPASATEAPAPPPAAPAADADPTKGHILDATGYLLPAQTVELGMFYMGYGITDWLTVGTSPGLWVIGPLIGGVVANASVKLGVPITHWVNVGVEASPIWLKVDKGDHHGRGWIVPLTGAVSLNATESQDVSLAFRYVAIAGKDDASTDNQEIGGTTVVSLAQLIGDYRIRFSEKFGLYSRAYYEVWEKNLGANGVYQVDDATTVEIEGEADPVEESRPWAIIVGAQFRFGGVNLRVGGGYGNFFVPRIGPFIPKKTFVPDLDFYVRF